MFCGESCGAFSRTVNTKNDWCSFFCMNNNQVFKCSHSTTSSQPDTHTQIFNWKDCFYLLALLSVWCCYFYWVDNRPFAPGDWFDLARWMQTFHESIYLVWCTLLCGKHITIFDSGSRIPSSFVLERRMWTKVKRRGERRSRFWVAAAVRHDISLDWI